MPSDPTDPRALVAAAVAAHGGNQSAFARALGVNGSTVRRWLSGARQPSATAIAVCERVIAEHAPPTPFEDALQRLRRVAAASR